MTKLITDSDTLPDSFLLTTHTAGEIDHIKNFCGMILILYSIKQQHIYGGWAYHSSTPKHIAGDTRQQMNRDFYQTSVSHAPNKTSFTKILQKKDLVKLTNLKKLLNYDNH